MELELQEGNYALEDDLLTSEKTGIAKEINKDLKTLQDIDTVLNEEIGDLSEDNDQGNDSVDEDNFFLEDEEERRKTIQRPNAGKMLFECFRDYGVRISEPKGAPPSKKRLVSFDDDDSEVEEIIDDDEEDTSSSSSSSEEEGEVRNEKNKSLITCPHATIDGCTFTSVRHRYIKCHINAMHRALSASEECCGLFFKTRAELYEHTRNLHKGSEFACVESSCPNLRFPQRWMLRRHVTDVHLNIKFHKCDRCDYESSSRSDIRRHRRSQHGVVESGDSKKKKKIYNCDQCHYTYNSKVKYNRHISSAHKKTFPDNDVTIKIELENNTTEGDRDTAVDGAIIKTETITES